MGATTDIAEWTASVHYEDIPERLHARSKAQILSVLGAVHAGRHSEGAVSALEAVRTWGSGDESVAWLSGERLPRHSAIFANACASVSFDFDDYVFAGHTGHSAVCAAFAYASELSEATLRAAARLTGAATLALMSDMAARSGSSSPAISFRSSRVSAL